MYAKDTGGGQAKRGGEAAQFALGFGGEDKGYAAVRGEILGGEADDVAVGEGVGLAGGGAPLIGGLGGGVEVGWVGEDEIGLGG